MSKRSGMRSKHNTNTQTHLLANGLCHAQCICISGPVTFQCFGWSREIGAMHQHKVGSSYSLKGTSSVEEQSLTVEMEVVVQNRAVIDHAAPSNTVNKDAFVAEHAVPVNRRHGDHVWVSCIRNDALAVGPNLNRQTVASIGEGGAAKTGVVFCCT